VVLGELQVREGGRREEKEEEEEEEEKRFDETVSCMHM